MALPDFTLANGSSGEPLCILATNWRKHGTALLFITPDLFDIPYIPRYCDFRKLDRYWHHTIKSILWKHLHKDVVLVLEVHSKFHSFPKHFRRM